MTGLLTAAFQMGIRHLQVFLDSQLLVSQLNNCYQVRDPCLFRKFLRTKQLSRQFESITFTHIPRAYNSIADQMANNVLDWHINHTQVVHHHPITSHPNIQKPKNKTFASIRASMCLFIHTSHHIIAVKGASTCLTP